MPLTSHRQKRSPTSTCILFTFSAIICVSVKSEVPLLALRESPALFFFGHVPNVRVPRGRCHRTVHDATVVQKFSFALLRRRSLCSVCFPKNSTDVGRNKQFPTPCTCTGTRSAGASVGYMMPSSVVTDTSTTLRVRFQDRWSTSHYRTRGVSASSSSVVHHFPGTKVQDVRPSRSIREEAFPRSNFLFVRSQRQRGSGAHIFRVGRGPQSPLASPFVPPSFSCLSRRVLPFFLKTQKKKNAFA